MDKNKEVISEIGWNLKESYTKLPNILFSELKPDRINNPRVIKVNNKLAAELGLNFSKLTKSQISNLFAGNELPPLSRPFSQSYAGHQFGHFTILGDGRAHMLGEQMAPDGHIYDIQFKGSGKTPFSRGADGKAALGPMLREYLISEAMHFLNIPTTRSLAVIETGEKIYREVPLKGAILTRVAKSHIRFGTFQFLAAHKDYESMSQLLDYSIERHFQINKITTNKALGFIEAVMARQIDLIIHWMRVGFIHGVMNTDNSTISGETIDYGPCAFMDQYDFKTVFSSIDAQGRYAFGNQPTIIQWNLVRLAECLLPLIDKQEKEAIKKAQASINKFGDIFNHKWKAMMLSKIGIETESVDDEELINTLLSWMQEKNADYTNTFCHLMDLDHANDEIYEDQQFSEWKHHWQERTKKYQLASIMKNINPVMIPRNHLVEEALSDAETNHRFDKFENLLTLLSTPYTQTNLREEFVKTPKKSENKYQTFCGT